MITNIRLKKLSRRDLNKLRELRQQKKKDSNLQGYDSAYLSTDDDSNRDLNIADWIVKEWLSLPLIAKKQLQIIKEDPEEQYNPYGEVDQLEMMEDK